MKKYLIIYAVVATAVIVFGAKFMARQTARLRNNNVALSQSVEYYRTETERAAASAQVLRLKVGEYEELRAADAAKIRDMGLKIRRLESTAKSITTTTVEVRVPVVDSVVVLDTVRLFCWRDSWVTVEGKIAQDSVECKVHSVDTLKQIVYRVPRKFLFFRFGTKAIKQHIVSSNPHTEVVYTEYIKIGKR